MSEHCTLSAVLGAAVRCSGGTCAFWDASAGACVLRDIERDLRGRPALALHLLELRSELESRRQPDRVHFSVLLNDEQDAEAR